MSDYIIANLDLAERFTRAKKMRVELEPVSKSLGVPQSCDEINKSVAFYLFT